VRKQHFHINRKVSKCFLLFFVAAIVLLAGCSSSRPYTLGPIKTFDPDNADIPPPAEREEHFSWETLYYSSFYQFEKVLDLGHSFQKAGHALGLNKDDQADNVNVLDEVPKSSWYTPRHYFEPMRLAELKQGPNLEGGPDTTQTIAVIRGKSEGVTPGFTVRDARGDTYIIKLDDLQTPGSKSSSEVIGTLIYYASGYYTPQNSISHFDPQQLAVDENATITRNGIKQSMGRADLDSMLKNAYKRDDGKVRVLASKYVEGQPLGPWSFKGTRKDDPNDRLPHEDRREVRGLGVLASWLNDTDRRTANTLATYIEEDGKNYIRHYLLDMGSTLGTNGRELRHTKRGQEYRYDPRYMGLQYITLGLYEKPWAKPGAIDRPYYPSVGYYEYELFNPGSWVPSYPNPAFEKITALDGFWGAKMVMAFSDDEIRAIVKSGQLPDPAAEDYLVEVLKERRDKIGRYWFKKVNPLDKFEVVRAGEEWNLKFADLGIEGGLFDSAQSSYCYSISIKSKKWVNKKITKSTSIPLDLEEWLLQDQKEPIILKLQIHTLREERTQPNKKVTVYVAIEEAEARVIGLERES
jgi:hypothetical protein